MELKDIEEPSTPFDIATWCKTAANQSGGLSISQAVRIMNMIEAYGNSRYNAALGRAAESAEVKTVWYDEDKSAEVDKQSILNLKIGKK
jgi:hypothetical protein